MTLSRNEVMDRLTRKFDKQFPNATEFDRGSVLYEYRKTLDALWQAGMKVVAR